MIIRNYFLPLHAIEIKKKYKIREFLKKLNLILIRIKPVTIPRYHNTSLVWPDLYAINHKMAANSGSLEKYFRNNTYYELKLC